MSHHIQPCSVEAYLSGIVNQLKPHFPHSWHSTLVKCTMQGALCSLGCPIIHKQPIIRDDLACVIHTLPHPLTHNDLFLLHLGELVAADDPSMRDFTKFSLHTSRDKMDMWYKGNKVMIQQVLVGSDPLPLFTCFLASRDAKFLLHPYLWLRSDGCPPTCSWFIQRLRMFFPDSILGHSMQAGGATSLAAAGVSPEHIQAPAPQHVEELFLATLVFVCLPKSCKTH
ncbi:uncharacterized protein BJ212DRAFT_1448237 [Suillus subaureus]|uniref:Uncharacterized protein n=1 Tax=Suillus subaureus TaxID=48587 RepID=A0A9P7E6F5_9AGAM|nr:uncharacterized protein BJ212DRAFT_1448237 [Suillus subaureus]KAG1812130.1 hypothetical protein BJ212DRAFT_1448237 [Suillus subaureus]